MKSTTDRCRKLRNVTRYVIACSAFFVTAVVLLSFLIPLFAAFFPNIFSKNFTSFNLENKIEYSRLLKITFFTLKIAFGSTFVAIFIGFPAAFFCSKRNFLFKKFLLGLSAVPLCIPILIASLGFVSVFGMSGILNNIIKSFGFSKIRLLYSEFGIMIAQGFYNFPLVMSITTRFWSSLSEETENAARLLGTGEFRVFYKITFPKLLPCLASSVIPVFLFCFFSFMMVLLFSVPGTSTLEVELYQTVKTSLDYNMASKLAITETFTAVLLVVLYSLLMGSGKTGVEVFTKKKLPYISSADYESVPVKILECFLFILLIILILLFFIFPLGGIVVSGFTARVSGKDVFSFNQYKTLFKSPGFWEALLTTLKISFFTGFLCTLVSTVYSLLINKKNSSLEKKFLEVLALLPMAVSSVVLGFGLTILFKKGNALSLVLVQTALFWPLAFRQISTAVEKIPSDVINASELLTSNYLETSFRVILPWIKESLFASFGFCFAFSAGDTTLPLILSVPKFQTLSLYTYRLSGSYRFNTACASGTILALLCFVVFMISEKAGEKK